MSKKSTKLEALCETFRENEITPESLEGNGALIEKIKEQAAAVPDYRHPSYTRHLLSDIIMIVFFAVLGNANEWGEIESFARKKEKWLRKYLELPNGIPTDDTFRLVISNIDTTHFFEVTVHLLLQTVDGILALAGKEKEIHEKSILSVDGKESRGSKRKTGDCGEVRALQTLNVYSADYGICLAQRFIEEKTNEIPAAQELLKLIDLKGSVVTADAMNCQKETAAVIAESRGDYVLALKGNQPLFYQEVKDFFSEEEQAKIRKNGKRWKKTVEKEHGGIAEREYFITDEVSWYSEKGMWKKLRTFGMVHKVLKKEQGKEEEYRYYIGSIEPDVELFERASRGHWGIEVNLHWHLDFTFRDDKNKSMEKAGAKNMQIMKKIALSILRLVKESYKMSMKRIRYELSLDYENEVERLLAMLDIDSIKQMIESKGKSPEK